MFGFRASQICALEGEHQPQSLIDSTHRVGRQGSHTPSQQLAIHRDDLRDIHNRWLGQLKESQRLTPSAIRCFFRLRLIAIITQAVAATSTLFAKNITTIVAKYSST